MKLKSQKVWIKTPWVRLALWENKISHWGVHLRPDGCILKKKKLSHTGIEVAAEEEEEKEEEKDIPPTPMHTLRGKMEENMLQ